MTGEGTTGASREAARSAKDELRALLADEPGMQGIGLARADDGGWAVVINVTTAAVHQRVAARLDHQADWRGPLVRIRVTGPTRTLPDDNRPG